jgi:hypothetical protein
MLVAAPLAPLLVFLVMAFAATIPTWPYSRTWGFYPSAALALLITIVITVGAAATRATHVDSADARFSSHGAPPCKGSVSFSSACH